MKEEEVVVKRLPIVMIGNQIAVLPLAVKQKQDSGIIIQDKALINAQSGQRFDLDKSKELAVKALADYDKTMEHPYQGIIVAIGPRAEEAGYKIGDILYTSSQIALTRSIIQVNGIRYPVIGIESSFAVVGNIGELEDIVINSETIDYED